MEELICTTVSAPAGDDCAERVFDELGRALARDGWGIGDILKMRIFYSGQDQYPGFSAARTERFRGAFAHGAFPATTGVVTGYTPDGPGIEIEVMASRQRWTANSDRVYRTFPGTSTPPAFVHLAERGDLAVLSGQTGFDATGADISADVRDQARTAVGNLSAVLSDSGWERATLPKVTVYVTDPAWCDPALDEARRFAAQANGARQPDIALVVVDELFKPGVFVEVEAVAEPESSDPSPWLFATGRALAGAGQTDEDHPLAPLDDALADVARQMTEAGFSTRETLACTAWVAGKPSLAQARSSVASFLGDSGVTAAIVPMREHPGDGGRALVEIVARRRREDGP
jgi:enamine deaminase RidA (YjgF/YER057c/UK114 family)